MPNTNLKNLYPWLMLLNFIFMLVFIETAVSEEIKYEIIEVSTGNIIGNGTKKYTSSDIIERPYRVKGNLIVEKFIELEKGYKIGARLFQDQELRGFGLLAGVCPCRGKYLT